jgi:hypothetical protein
MKKYLLVLLASFSFAAVSNAESNYDGCYQLYLPGSMYPSFCLDGSQEVGINGSGVRLVIFDTNTDSISACALSSSVGGSENSFEFLLGNQKEFILSDVKLVQSRFEGTATFGKTNLNFIKLSDSVSKRLLAKFYAETKCQQINPGQIVKF